MTEDVKVETNIEIKQKKPVIVFGSDSPYYPTGFAQQCGYIANIAATKMDWETHYLGWQTRGNPDIKGFNYKIHGILGRAPFGKDTYQHLFEEVGPDILFTQGDGHMVDTIPKSAHPFWIWYYPLDGDPINPLIASVLEKADVRVAMSRYGQELTRNQMRLDAEYVPHGVDTKIFSPANKTECKKAFFEMFGINTKCDIEESFVFLSMARLNLRKHHIRLLRAFDKFLNTGPSKAAIKEKKEKCYLYLHLDPKDPLFMPDPNHDYIFSEWLDVFDLRENVIITPQFMANRKRYDYINGIPAADLALLYNLAAVHVLSTGGEGFGIPTVEAMACGKPSIITDYTTSYELVGADDKGELLPQPEQRGTLVPPSNLYMENCGVRKAWVDIDAFSAAMENYYKNPELIDVQSKACRKWATKHYSWKVVEKMWIELFDKVNNKVDLV